MLDGDLLAQFLDLTSIQQEAVLGLPIPSKKTPTLNQVVRLLERVHCALHWSFASSAKVSFPILHLLVEEINSSVILVVEIPAPVSFKIHHTFNVLQLN